MTGKYTFSVVTVSFNCAGLIAKTIESVLRQDYASLEYIVIDGGSTDGTAEIIREYQDRLAYWCSEPDGGIYQGMNKGIQQAQGDWIIFMNAGDTFADDHVLTQIASYADKVKGMLSVELNAGQMVEDVRLAVNGKVRVEHFGRLGGIVFTPDEVLDALKEKLL